ncbi:DUF3784 domain-containing protein [Amedibacillus sp. YH-ame10]
MNTPIWVPFIIVVILVIISIILLLGKASFLIAGYNMLPKENQQKYNTKRLCRVVGCGSSVIAIILGVATFYRFEMPPAISWIIPWGLFATIAVVAILVHTICWRKP